MLETMRQNLKPTDTHARQDYDLLLKRYTEESGHYAEYLKTHTIPKNYVSTPPSPWTKPGETAVR